MRRFDSAYVSVHGAFAYPDRNGVTTPELGSNLCRHTQAVSFAKRWIEIDGVAEVVLT